MLKLCAACHQKISDDALVCPQCGASTGSSSTQHFCNIAQIVVAVVFTLFATAITLFLASNFFHDGGFDLSVCVAAVVVWLLALGCWMLVRKSSRAIRRHEP